MRKEFIIFQEKEGIREKFKTEIGIETVKEEVKRLNQLNNGVKYGYREKNQLKPKNPQTNRLY